MVALPDGRRRDGRRALAGVTLADDARDGSTDPSPGPASRGIDGRSVHVAPLRSPVLDEPRDRTIDGEKPTSSRNSIGRRTAFLSTMPVTPNERRLALAVVLVSILGFVVIVPFARLPLPKTAAFIPSYESALAINDLITAVLLFGQFRWQRSSALLALASGYMFDALMVILHALSFPGVFAPTGLIGGGDQTTAWLYVFWHAGFPVFVVAYVVLAERSASGNELLGRSRVAVSASIGGVFAIVCGLTLLATLGHDFLPVIIRGGDFTLLVTKGVSPTLLILSLLALLALWRRRRPAVLDLWLMVVMCAWVLDVALSAVIGSSRYDLGWYAGRSYGLLAASFVLAVLLMDASGLHSRLAEAKVQIEDYAARLEQRVRELHAVNEELEAFSYSVSHDLRAPLRAIDGFSQALLEDCADRLDEDGRGHLARVRQAAQRMGLLIDDLLKLARISRAEVNIGEVDLGALAHEIADELQRTAPQRSATFEIAPNLIARGDSRLLRVVLDNLLNNAWKFTSGRARAHIAFGAADIDGKPTYFVRDNGVGFDMAYAGKLFGAFQRLHDAGQFPGTGVGLATVQRIIHKHGGEIWAEAELEKGSTFYFTL